MIAVNDDLMSDQSFLEWVKGKNYLLWQTGTKERFRLKIDRTEYLVTGLHKKVRKGLNIATAHGYYELEPVLADKWEPLTIEEFGALKPGDRVHVLQRCGMIQECVLKDFGFGLRGSRAASYSEPGKPEKLSASDWNYFYKPKGTNRRSS
jgi:hypothetical protein